MEMEVFLTENSQRYDEALAQEDASYLTETHLQDPRPDFIYMEDYDRGLCTPTLSPTSTPGVLTPEAVEEPEDRPLVRQRTRLSWTATTPSPLPSGAQPHSRLTRSVPGIIEVLLAPSPCGRWGPLSQRHLCRAR